MMDKEKAPPPSYTEYPALKPLKRWVAAYLDLQAQAREIDTRKRELQDLILPAMAKARVDAVLVGEEPVRVIESTQKRLSKERLVELGVSVAVIQKATIETPRAPYVMVGRRHRSNGGEE
jgi:hypothetical protein